jgi:tRNA (cytidine/uridine-2'-O-)-methyltransferase
MLHVALWQPEIPPNTGNIARLCAATGAALHLIGPLGFHLDDKSLRRAGVDYWTAITIHRHVSFDEFCGAVIAPQTARLWCFSAAAHQPYTAVRYLDGDVLLFGNESRGLPDTIREGYRDQLLTIPMPGGNVRSLNLATAVGIALYEALRQLKSW